MNIEEVIELFKKNNVIIETIIIKHTIYENDLEFERETLIAERIEEIREEILKKKTICFTYGCMSKILNLYCNSYIESNGN